VLCSILILLMLFDRGIIAAFGITIVEQPMRFDTLNSLWPRARGAIAAIAAVARRGHLK
jgi:hypothetical protein